ncbi:MMPL family transporter [Nocardioides lianchengensis]|uniref:Putative drug exporter of the RND superfamily n=1 Tax=Nocardioides lianchengensis TaxID=1045774 RepID=A0A1G6LEL7_9ACTN|nr:MMPL family transporter [Nocardioides lianchengensis]NYG12583.1 RND superfamily putative drug exporter [Nocardioides lianchengensis]SDC41654.1 putative drug exporter of the RND superfamily [Nocardioides lianchengensis]
MKPVERLLTTIHAFPRRSLAAILLFVALAGVIGGPVAGALQSDGGFAPADAESARAVERIEAATGQQASAGLVLLVEPAADAGAVADTLAGIDGLAEVTPGGTSTDGSSALVLGTVTAGVDDEVVAHDVVEAFADDEAVTVGGSAVAGLQLGEQVEQDLTRAELLALPILVLLSILIFGGRAAVLPLVVGIATVLGTFLVLTGANQVYGLSIFALNLVIGLGLGLAIDYSLFLLSRYREELQRQGPTAAAVRTTMATAGRTVVYSAATVAVALATLAVFPMGFLRSMGIAGAAVAVVAAAASLLIAPAIFSLWGARLARRTRGEAATEGRWYRFSHAVMRRPGLVATGTAAVMLVLAAPALQASWTPVDGTVVPTDLSARIVSDTLEAEYDGDAGTPVTVAVSSDDPAEVAAFATDASALPGVLAPAQATELGSGVWQLDLVVDGDPAGNAAQDVVAEVRDLAGSTGADALVTGPAAEFVDQQAAIAASLPLAVGLLVVLTMLVLWLMTGSVVLPVKAVVMNVLTVGVALGAIAFIYQGGRLTGLLGYTPNGGIEPTNFLVAAALVFALSTDYGVFLLGRIKEARDSGLTEREAVATGLGRTGGIVTAAAILLAVAIGAFSTSEISFMQQIGIATAVGVLVDAFIVRSLLVPALMGLMGKWNWWAPMWLRRVHDRVGLSEGEKPADRLVLTP